MNAVSGSILFVLVVTVAAAPRRWALLAIPAGVFFLTQGHSLDIAGLNIYPLRVLELVAFARVVVRRELRPGSLNRIDATLLLLYNYTALVWILRSSNVTPQQFAVAVDPTLCYLAVRGLLTGLDDLRWFLVATVTVLVPFTALVLVERLRGASAFTLVGAEPELLLRSSVARCQGSFRHAILMGSVAASFLSLYIGLLIDARVRAVAALGISLCLFLVLLSNSGGPLTSTLAVIVGWSVWFVRTRMRAVRWFVLAMLLALALVMKAPLWYLPAKISGMVGGGGWHRSYLLEQAWTHLDKWWLAGMDIKDTISWMPYVLDTVGGADVTNEYLAFGLMAGLPAVVLAVALLSFAFADVGHAVAAARRSGETGAASEALLWGLGVAILVHAVSWWGVSYFDQSFVVWLLHLAAVSAATHAAKGPSREPRRARRSRRPIRLPRVPVRERAPARLGGVAAAASTLGPP